MSKIVLSKTHGKYTISIQLIQDICFLLYLLATSAHQTGEGFDAIFIRVSFVLFIGFSALSMISKGSFKWTGLLSWFLLFLGYGYLSCLWASSVTLAVYYTNNFIQMIGCIICLTNRIKNKDDIEKMLKLILISMVYTALVLYIKTPMSAWGTERIGGELGFHPNDVGLRFALGVMISLYFAIVKKKYYNYVFVVLFTVVTMLSGSRKGLLMCVIALILFPIISYQKKGTQKDFIKLLGRVCLIVVAIMLVYYIVMNNKMFYDVIGFRLESMTKSFEGDASADGSIRERSFFIRKAIELFKAHPVFGYGMNNFQAYMKEINYRTVAYSHNDYVEILSTLGLIGFMIYYSFIAKMIVNYLNVFVKNKENRPLTALMFIMLVSICFIGYWNVNYCREYQMLYYILIYMYLKTVTGRVSNG